jgi:hypothetical protein
MKKTILSVALCSAFLFCSIFMLSIEDAEAKTLEPLGYIEVPGHIKNGGVNDNWMSINCDGTGELTCKYPIYG